MNANLEEEILDNYKSITQEEFEETVRVDRTEKDKGPGLLENYHLTETSIDHLENLLNQLQEVGDYREGYNYWLYGFFGSGKSHFLAVLSYLFDSQYLNKNGFDSTWDHLVGSNSSSRLNDLYHRWVEIHEEQPIKTFPIHLLGRQTRREETFSRIILKHLFNWLGYSVHPEIAFAEIKLEEEGFWDDRNKLLKDILDKYPSLSELEFSWEDLQKYPLIGQNILRQIFEKNLEGYNFEDILPGSIRPETAVRVLIEESSKKFQNDYKLFLMLDEVTLFFGQHQERVTELNNLAEKIDKIGNGRIHNMVTAQESLEQIRPSQAIQEIDYGLLNDRFSRKLNLPSKHSNEIVESRVLQNSKINEKLDNFLEEKSLSSHKLEYRKQVIQRNTNPTLDEVERSEYLETFPLLPYHTSLWVRMLEAVRDNTKNTSKSVFSGTARAILAMAKGLLDEWVEHNDLLRIPNLVDFYDMIETELREIIPKDTSVIDEIDEKELIFPGRSLDVAKVLLLYQLIPNTIDLSENYERTIALGIYRNHRDDLTQLETKVSKILDDLQQFFQPVPKPAAGEPAFRITKPRERELHREADRLKSAFNYPNALKDFLDELDVEEFVEVIDLPQYVEWGKDDQKADLSYQLFFNGLPISQKMRGNELKINIDIRAFSEDTLEDIPNKSIKLKVTESATRENLKTNRLKEWWALNKAVGDSRGPTPDLIRKNLQESWKHLLDSLSKQVKESEVDYLSNSFSSLKSACEEYINTTYPSEKFHPKMKEIDIGNLKELEELSPSDPLPDWARSIGVPPSNDNKDRGDIADHVRWIGKLINERPLTLQRIKKEIIEKDPFYSEVFPAIQAVLWGLCRRGEFEVLDEERKPVNHDVLLKEKSEWFNYLLNIDKAPKNLKAIMEEAKVIEPDETVSEGKVKLKKINNRLIDRTEQINNDLTNLKENLSDEALKKFPLSLQKHISGQRNQCQKNLDQISDNPDWKLITKETIAVRGRINDIEELVSQRKTYLLYWDWVLNFANHFKNCEIQDFDENIDSFQTKLATFSEHWWENWDSIVTKVDEEAKEIIKKIENEWQAFLKEQGLQGNVKDIGKLEKITSQKNVTPLNKAYTEFIEPLKNLAKSIGKIDKLINDMRNIDPSVTKTSLLEQFIGRTKKAFMRLDKEYLGTKEFDFLMDQLNKIASDADSEKLVGLKFIALLPDDAEELKKTLKGIDSIEKNVFIIGESKR